jgi:hypothetical protein
MPFLATGNDGLRYVVKLPGALSHSNALFNEAAGAELYRALGLPTPMWRLVYLPAEILALFDARRFDGGASSRSNISFGSCCVWRPEDRVTDLLPSSSFARIKQPELFWLAWLTDVCASHANKRQALFIEDSDRRILPQFIDHKEMFGGVNGGETPTPVASRYLDPRAYPAFADETCRVIDRHILSLDCDTLIRRINCLPTDWRTSDAQKSFAAALDRLTQRRVWESLLENISLISHAPGKPDDANRHPNLQVSTADVRCASGDRQSRST